VRFWGSRILCGFLLGVSIAALQTDEVSSGWTIDFVYYFPAVSAPNEIGLPAFLSSLLVWSGETMLLAMAVGLVEWWARPGELRAWPLALTVLVGAVAAVLIWQAFILIMLRDVLGVQLIRYKLGTSVVWIEGVLYHSWLLLFFGGLGTSVFASQRRRARMLASLRVAELARARSQQRLAEARLALLEARVDPDHLFQTLARLEQLYGSDPVSAAQLLDELIAFLRNGLADIRASASSSPPIDAQQADNSVLTEKCVSADALS